MLTDIEKERVRLEETYRNEIRESIQKDTRKKKSPIVAFLNSALGLWILSAIFLTGGIRLYENYKYKLEDLKKTEEAIGKIDLEIGFRFAKVVASLYELSKNKELITESFETSETTKLREVANAIGDSKNSENNFLYTEYSNWSLLALLAEEKRLYIHLGKNTERLDRVIGHISALTIFYEDMDYTKPTVIAEKIQAELWLNEWKSGGFYFSEGNGSNPFP